MAGETMVKCTRRIFSAELKLEETKRSGKTRHYTSCSYWQLSGAIKLTKAYQGEVTLWTTV
ncbi:hypothetical protein TUMSATVNIG1_58020 (plasmid) [Vibrio nigripulchritudo]|nr:hypothetical protein VNTUMSATTG_57530 [Vibrio nigripulchritudo]BDU35193.1 hypothetical protein TUMSATVNIG1_58020 [Vibrio nigripulchritudo]